MDRADVSNLGVMKQVAEDDGVDPTVWSGGISLGDGYGSKVDEVVGQLNTFFVFVDKAAPTRCIDGRPNSAYKNDPNLLTRRLGPSVAGCTSVFALDYHLVTTIDDTHTTLAQDVAAVAKMLSQLGIGCGAHTDDHHSETDDDTGCGALDKMPAILSKMLQPKATAQIKTLAAKLLGNRYDEVVVDQLLARVKSLQIDADIYLGRDPASGAYAGKQAVVTTVRHLNPNAVEELSGPHNEKALVLNLAKGGTFDRDKFAAANKGAMEMFDYDVWFVDDAAKALFPVDEKRRNMFVIFHVIYSLATAMVLTDGTLPLIIRR